MSHRHERNDKNCLNCGSTVHGRFCQVCGQENVEPKETLGSMIHHFFNDITHFDGKFFSSMGTLFRRPGFLPKQYILGRRQKYLNPIRMYVFTSAVFFVIFFTLYKFDGTRIGKKQLSPEQKQAFLDDRLKKAENRHDSLAVLHVAGLVNRERDSLRANRKLYIGGSENQVSYLNTHDYDSIQASLPNAERDSWFKRYINRKALGRFEHFEGRESEMMEIVINRLLHSIPYMLFISLPLYALFLYLMHKKKRFYFADHIIFLVHLYIFTFLLILMLFGMMRFNAAWLAFPKALLLIYGIYYTLKSMKVFYEQSWGKTILKFLLFNLACVFSLILLIVLFSGVILFQV